LGLRSNLPFPLLLSTKLLHLQPSLQLKPWSLP
jgi:hypothetical protein